ncbi:hypothetical protein B0H13DRAFT_1025037 [Mycena leptocephala]|nr:hypothetical protein B0H13DRAFT_1025037 [Mycena leptocephala]
MCTAMRTHTSTQWLQIVTGIENTASSFLDAPCDIWSESASYSCQLLRQGRGFPLYVPGPPGNLPDEYQRSGVSIGDVGTVTPDGEFDFFFNIYLEADHPINANYVPDDFSPLKKCCIARDIIPSSQDPGSHVSTSSVQKLEPDPQFNEFPGGHFMFSCGAPKGAVLALPHGAHLQKLRNLETLRTYVAKHAESWYKYIRVTRGRELENGSLYLVTGWEKAPSWGMASFRGAGGGFQLAFQPTATTLTPRADSTSAAMLDPTSTPRIDSTSSYQYRWSGVSGV